MNSRNSDLVLAIVTVVFYDSENVQLEIKEESIRELKSGERREFNIRYSGDDPCKIHHYHIQTTVKKRLKPEITIETGERKSTDRPHIYGTIQNPYRTKELAYVEIKTIFFNSNDIEVSSDISRIYDISAGKKRRFIVEYSGSNSDDIARVVSSISDYWEYSGSDSYDFDEITI